jgi:RNA polymerase sigma-70 factor, ECF subfamily
MGDLVRISHALQTLRPDQRTAVIRAYYFGESLTDIATQEHVPPEMVRMRLHSAMHALRSTLELADGA